MQNYKKRFEFGPSVFVTGFSANGNDQLIYTNIIYIYIYANSNLLRFTLF